MQIGMQMTPGLRPSLDERPLKYDNRVSRWLDRQPWTAWLQRAGERVNTHWWAADIIVACPLGLPGLLAYELVWVAFAAAKGLLPAWWRGKRELLAELPALRAQRRSLQAARKVGDGELLRAQPLTHAPMVKQGALARVGERLLDLFLRGWWALVRPLVP